MDKIPYFRLKYSLIRKLMFQLAQIMGMVQLCNFVRVQSTADLNTTEPTITSFT